MFRLLSASSASIDRPRSCLFDCLHLVLCFERAEELERCPICRAPIAQRIQKRIVYSERLPDISSAAPERCFATRAAPNLPPFLSLSVLCCSVLCSFCIRFSVLISSICIPLSLSAALSLHSPLPSLSLSVAGADWCARLNQLLFAPEPLARAAHVDSFSISFHFH